MKKCARLQSQLSSLESLKYSGMTQLEIGHMVLHLLRLLTATTKVTTATTATGTATFVTTIHYEEVGYIRKITDAPLSEDADNSSKARDMDELKQQLFDQPFCLPVPARETLLSLLISILSNKGPLRSVSNAAIFPETTIPTSPIATTSPKQQLEERWLLILHWSVLFRMLLRTAPYLDEHFVGHVPTASHSRLTNIQKRTVQLIRHARHFFEQGLQQQQVPVPLEGDTATTTFSSTTLLTDRTARELWSMVRTDIMFRSHTHACYRGLILLYLFAPSRCSTNFYLQVMPEWFDGWTSVDRSPEMDSLWLVLFCRARKYLQPDLYDWGPIRRRLLTQCQYWLQLPIGGVSMDKSFPSAAPPRVRACPAKLKAFVGSSSSYQDGINFIIKVSKLLVTSLGTSGPITTTTTTPAIPVTSTTTFSENGSSPPSPPPPLSEGTRDILRFLSFVAPYFNPSNVGSWTFTLGAFLHYFSYELACRVGITAAMNVMKKEQDKNPTLVAALYQAEPYLPHIAIPPHELVTLLDALLPLCQQALYSKNSHVSRGGESAMVYLAQMDPVHVTPAFIDFAMRALDIGAVNLSHQAPAALSALTRLVQPALRTDPSILLVRLPDILRLTLAGIDSNDQNKTIRTLILYRSLASWIPVGKVDATWHTLDLSQTQDNETREDGTRRVGTNLFRHLTAMTQSAEYRQALERLPDSTLLNRHYERDEMEYSLLIEEAASSMSDWVLEFLDRIFALLRATGEREKEGKTSSGVANHHSTVDVHQARNFSRVLKECLGQVFASMDDAVHKLAIRSVARFIEEESLPAAAKDASFLCEAVAAARIVDDKVTSPGLDCLVPILTNDLQHSSANTVTYRLRCLAGAVRSAGSAVTVHRTAISKALAYALASQDKHVFKTGCKILRHTLATVTDCYPLHVNFRPTLVFDGSNHLILGRSAQLSGDAIRWHIPDADQIDFAFELLHRYILQNIANVTKQADFDSSNFVSMEERSAPSVLALDVPELRRCLRVIRYSIRGGASILLDRIDSEMPIGVSPMNDEALIPIPHETATARLMEHLPNATRESLVRVRGTISSFLIALSSVVASEEMNQETSALRPKLVQDMGTDHTQMISLSSDTKVCKQLSEIASLLLTRRGAAFRSQEAMAIWKAQKQLVADFLLCAQGDHLAESLQRASLYGDSSAVLYKDGEDAGKTISQRLLVSRIHLFYTSFQRSASFEIPRRLRRLERANRLARDILFASKWSVSEMMARLADLHVSKPPHALDLYEGLVDSLFSLSCHSNTRVRAAGIGGVDYALTRFGWMVHPRVPRLLDAVALKDEKLNGKFGVPSCAQLIGNLDGQGKRKRLSEVMKGVCSILAMSRAARDHLWSEKGRLRFMKTMCTTEGLIALMPTEEVHKIVQYLQSIFSPFRSKYFSFQLVSAVDKAAHHEGLLYLLEALSEAEEENTNDASPDKGAAHWRKLLLVGWFLTTTVDQDDVQTGDELSSRLWSTCFQVIENEAGQPLQRVALGLLGRLVSLSGNQCRASCLREKMQDATFCKVFGQALAYDHREDSSVGGGHDAQWSSGVEEILRDATRNVASRALSPFQRTNQSSGVFKLAHAQLVESLLLLLDKAAAQVATEYLLVVAKELAVSPPSEDQRNRQVTSAELFGGVCRAQLRTITGAEQIDGLWRNQLLPFLEEVIPKIPASLSGAYFDAFRYGIQFVRSSTYFPLTAWIIGNIQSSLWQPQGLIIAIEEDGDHNGKNSVGTEGFAIQSKWLYLMTAILIELDGDNLGYSGLASQWCSALLLNGSASLAVEPAGDASLTEYGSLWIAIRHKLLPKLLDGFGHPYESCRDHIAGCLFRICSLHRKLSRASTAAVNGIPRDENCNHVNGNASPFVESPNSFVVGKLSSLKDREMSSFEDKLNALMTVRWFFSYCIHLGEAKYEFSDYVIPLLPVAFESLKWKLDEGQEGTPDNASIRALEAEVVKGFRYAVAEASVASVVSESSDINRVLKVVAATSRHEFWQVRHASAHFLRCFQGSHKFLFTSEHAETTTLVVAALLADERREVSSAAVAALTGILAASPLEIVTNLVGKYVSMANRSLLKKRKKAIPAEQETQDPAKLEQEQRRVRNQQTSVFFLCAAVLAQPYDTPHYVPEALAAISKHSFEKSAPLGVRDFVKKSCAEYKRTHMSDNWEVHRKAFSQEQLEALEDVVSSPHYYA
jgi:proteasome activator subunit 4